MERVSRYIPESTLGRLLVAQLIIFALAAVVSVALGILFSTALMLLGALIVVFRYVGRSYYDAATSDAGPQPGGQWRPSKALITGMIPLIAGIVLSFV